MDFRIPDFRPITTPISQEQNVTRRKSVQEVRTVTEPDILQKDQALFKHKLDPEEQSSVEQHELVIDQTDIRLSDLLFKLNNGNIKSKISTDQISSEANNGELQTQQITVNSANWSDLPGLTIQSDNLVETIRYRIILNNPSELIILDKWAKHSTRIWGDNKASTKYNPEAEILTFMLQDYTQISIHTHDAIIMAEIDILNGKQHILGHVINRRNQLKYKLRFKTILPFRSETEPSVKPHVVFVGGKGNDWFNNLGDLVWGKPIDTSTNNRYSRPNRAADSSTSSSSHNSNLIEYSA
ncbi:MAG: hypothetical protein JEZ06_00135 [Anaerolineaceae bacterium]|nr:hypothetical protein [Anaerolineaceae bacterium]